MQGHFGSEHVAPLGERFTLLLATHNRPAFLRRTLQYYSSYPCTIIVLDSSSQPDTQIVEAYPHVQYLHLPQFSYLGFQAKLKHGIGLVTTPYMAFAADDDFLLHSALTESVEFLEANPDYGMCHGYCMMYLTEATRVTYYRRDKKVQEDYASERAEDRVLDYMGQFIPPFFAVTRTELLRQWYDLMPEELSFEWQEIGHVYYLLACAKARILPIPYVVREANYGGSEHNTEVVFVLSFTDAKSVAEREKFADFLSTIPTAIVGRDQVQTREFALESFAAMSQCLLQRRSLTTQPIFHSIWNDPFKGPIREFGPTQFVEMPFYNQPFFDRLTEFEFLLHAMPAGKLQLERLEAVLLEQEQLLRTHGNDTERTIKARLWKALSCNAFNRKVVKRLALTLRSSGETEEADVLSAWAERLDGVSTQDSRVLLDKMPTGQLLNWLEARGPDTEQAASIARYLTAKGGSPRFCILLLDLNNDSDKLQVTFDSLLDSHFRAFQVVVFTTGEITSATTLENTLHFVKVSADNCVDKLNQVVPNTRCDWLLLAEAGDEFTSSGLMQASIELLAAPECRAVCADEVHRRASGTLTPVFRPDFNLDLLQSAPSLMARHWLIRRDVWVEAGGYSREFSQAVEFDLLLRLIEEGGLAGLAHLSEPLLICQAPAQVANEHERQTLVRHLGTRGYQAQVSAESQGTYRVDYRHSDRPQVSIIIVAQDNVADLQRCIVSVLQRTRYQNHELLIADNHNQSPELIAWLDNLEQNGRGRIRVVRAEQRLSLSALHNAVIRQAQGEFLVLLAADAQVVNANWIESLLNQAQRPEVGVVGGKLVDAEGNVTGAGLILGLNGEVSSPFVGEKKDAAGYMQRLVVEQNYSAVSGVCLMIRKDLYEAVGGLDQEHFENALGDVDLCLKVSNAGFLTVWTPQVQILHPGNLTQTPQAIDALRDKWQARFQQDPAYNQNLALTGKGFTLGEPTSVNWAQLLA
ncbi:TIGR00180 family glycosyltransferase [Pseudomonas cucumis]|uniref:TIGR00180 family glycosyltransferase n=1 Tax=Pseudomonas cucumis TaxID=2954082 RepID=A0ABY9F0T3_9PSED|nr:TIGR00180 family glycosyltransferase [Pseudomonas cucumis]WLG86422.1 TIGR00180 family glycosyltransferase [Pseudomonas cucumis]